MPCSSLAFVWITETEHQVFVQTGYHAFLRHASALSLHAEIIKSVQRQLYMRRDSTFCAKSVRYNIFTNGAPQQSSRIAFLTSRFVPLTSGLVETQRRCYFRCSNFFSVSDRFQTLASLFSCTSGSTAGWKCNLVLGQCFSTPSPQTQLSPRKALAESASTRDK